MGVLPSIMGDVNPFLVITAVVVTLIVIFLAWYFVHLFKHPTEEEANSATWSQILVIFSLTLTGVSILLPSMDQANGDGGIPMEDLWYTVFCSQALLSLAIIPWAIFYYENFTNIELDDQTGEVTIRNRCCEMRAVRTATCYSFVAVSVVLIMLFTMWSWAGEMEIPVESYSGKLKSYGTDGVMATSLGCPSSSSADYNVSECVGEEGSLDLQVTLAVYLIAFISFFGWFVFVIFGGVGFFGLPINLINSWRTRIQGLSHKRRDDMRKNHGHSAQEIHFIAKNMLEKWSDSSYKYTKEDQKDFATFKKAYTKLANKFNNYKMMCEVSEQNENSACGHCLGLVGGILGVMISIVWILHISLYMLPSEPISGMLNEALIYLDENVWGLFGTTLYAVFSFYLVLCVIQGNVDFGLNCICFKLHPLVPGDTLMGSFLFNAMILGVTSFSLVQFVSQAFQGYAGADSSSTILFHVSARNLKFFKYFFRNNVFIYCMLGVAVLNLLRLIWYTPKENDLEHMLGEYGNKGKSLDTRAQSLGHRDGTEMIEVNVTSDTPQSPARKSGKTLSPH